MSLSVEAFGWQAARKRLRTAPEVTKELGTAFQREEELEEEVLEENPAPSILRRQLEDGKAKCKRLTAEGGLLAEAERFAEALQHWEQALLFAEEPGERAKIIEQMAQVLLLLDRPFDAVRAAERAVESRPLWYPAHLTLGRALLSFGELERAVESLRRAAALVSQEESAGAGVDHEEAAEVRLELQDAERVWAEAKERASGSTSAEVFVNGRVVESRFWETALKVTYDERGMPTTHFPEEPETS
eukprot:TRINITY_DN63768_c0_g1_i1.p1 TRINITY_DN63768_c0_g1~~TRINITY_DN63768_c0_g1_i1.p1  ORF type:complete len:245 (+),score=79.37 TRINITY_DN63768_c0_g1_i1:108-842(+)